MRHTILFCLALAAGCSAKMIAPVDGSAGDQATGGSHANGDGSVADLALTDLDGGLLAARPYTMNLHVPPSYSPSTPAPLVILLHGYSATGAGQESYFRLTPVSDAHGFLYVYPDGTVDQKGYHFWNATDACCDFYGAHPDDVGYIEAIVADLESKMNVDRKRIFLVGHSNGGFMAHRLACDGADRFAAIVSLAGETWKDQSKCQPSGPVSVLEVQGTADATVPYAGGSLSPGAPAVPGAVETVGDWAAKDGCSGALAVSGPAIDLDLTIVGAETTVSAYSGCPQGRAVDLWSIAGGGHVPTFDTDPNTMPTWGERLWTWLSAHPKP